MPLLLRGASLLRIYQYGACPPALSPLLWRIGYRRVGLARAVCVDLVLRPSEEQQLNWGARVWPPMEIPISFSRMLSNVNSVLEVDYAIQSRNMIMKHMAPVMGLVGFRFYFMKLLGLKLI